MCRAKDQGNKRCNDYRAARKLSNEDLTPRDTDGVPSVEWADSTDIEALWKNHERDVACAAITAISAARKAEAKATSDVLAIATEAGGRANDLQYRMKSPESLARKITSKQLANEHKADNDDVLPTADEIAADIGDILRYTVEVSDHDSLTKAGTNAVRALKASGWTEITVEQSYLSGNTYKGFHIVGRPPGGPKTEVQVHSAVSLEAKHDTHSEYEIFRADNVSLEEQEAAAQRSRDRWAKVPTPPELDSLTNVDGIEIRKKAYR